MRIAVDAMGGDYAPSAVIEGAADALEHFEDIKIILVGHLEKISYYLEKYGLQDHSRLEKVHAEDVIEMNESSTAALRSKKNSSITVAAKLVKDGQADAIVTAGHTGAAVAATKVIVRTLPGIERAAIGTVMPAVKGRFILVDAGANTDCKAINLAQFAIMGEAYCQLILGIENPRIGLLSVGEEDSKGNELTKEAFKLLSKMPINFVGNVEGHDVFSKFADVVVCDGFVGNVLLKASESLAMATVHWLKDVFAKNAFRKTGAILARNAFRDLKAIGDFEEYGGAPLLGLNGICIIGHGSSNYKAVRNAIRVAYESMKFRINDKITARINESEMTIQKQESV
jgi:glycerol-3-phosphate acyltransferase PlsX